MIQRPLEGYEFPVFTTESCPRTLTEWNEQSTALNCNQTNAYMCVPNENITELLEFCYSQPQIRIVKGIKIIDVYTPDNRTKIVYDNTIFHQFNP